MTLAKFYFLIISTFSIFIIISSKDNSTLSNYLDISVNYIRGKFQPDFDRKIVYGDLFYNLEANENGNEIIFDTSKLNITKVYKVIKAKEEVYEEKDFSFGEEDPNLGTPLIIPIEYQKGDYLSIRIIFETTSEGESAQFLSENQTFGGKHPCFFTQSSMILGRSLFPCQDTPAIKVQFKLSIIVPKDLRGMISGIYEGEEIYPENEELKIFHYEEEVPVANYLIALAAGNFFQKNITDNIHIFSEPEFIEKVYNELVDDLPKVYNLSVEYMGPYKWEEYNILVLPRSFPYSGMENPSLNFISPCLINGDKSLIDIIFHELIHSWSGNLVTNENWSDFWLNEGITMFLQRKIVGMLKGDTEYARMDGYLGYFYIEESIQKFGEELKEFTKLKPNLTGYSPDDSFSDIPYEKGYNFIYYIETLIGEDLMQNFFYKYFADFEYQSIDFYQFKNYFLDFCENNNITDEILEKINWTAWIFTPGDIPLKLEENNKYKIEADEIVEKIKKEDFDNLEDEFLNLSSVSKTYILLSFESLDDFLTEKQHKFFTETLKLYENQNFLISTNYYRTILGKTDKFLDKELTKLIEYLSNYGAVDYMTGLYELFYKRDEIKAEETLNGLKDFYHSFMFDMAEKEIENAKKEFPIMKLDVKKRKYFYPYDDILELNVPEYKDDLGELILDNNIYLQSNNSQNESELICFLKSNNNQYCQIKDDIPLNIIGEFILEVKERIQKMKYAVKVSESEKFEIKEILIDEEKTKKEYKEELSSKNEKIKIDIYISEQIDFYIPVIFDNEEKLNLKCNINDNKIYQCELNRTFYINFCKNCDEYEKHNISMISKTGKSFLEIDLEIKNIKDDNGDDDNSKTILAIVLPCVILVIIAAIVAYFCYRRSKKREELSKNGDKMNLLSDI